MACYVYCMTQDSRDRLALFVLDNYDMVLWTMLNKELFDDYLEKHQWYRRFPKLSGGNEPKTDWNYHEVIGKRRYITWLLTSNDPSTYQDSLSILGKIEKRHFIRVMVDMIPSTMSISCINNSYESVKYRTLVDPSSVQESFLRRFVEVLHKKAMSFMELAEVMNYLAYKHVVHEVIADCLASKYITPTKRSVVQNKKKNEGEIVVAKKEEWMYNQNISERDKRNNSLR